SLHHTLGLKDAPSLVINFNPLLAYQNDPESYGYITLAMEDRELHRYLQSVLDSMDKEVVYNLHSANDYYHMLKFLLHTHAQVNERLELLSVEATGIDTEFLVGFKTEINSLKKRGVGAKLNEQFLSSYTYNNQLKAYEEEQLNLSSKVKDHLFGLNIELDGDHLRIRAINSVSLFSLFINLFFEAKSIESIGTPV
ncbi:MAG: hypothetical protein OEW87_12390, partial [Flavobacteriaceae bacterium]|nr:hypothetical protein [Flavobacteriaceae bacterium]